MRDVSVVVDRAWTTLLVGVNVAATAIVAWCYLVPAQALPVPVHPYREVSRCASGPLDWELVDANGDDHPDIVILCEEELLVASGLNGDTLWQQDLPRAFAGAFNAPRSLEMSEIHRGGTEDVIVVEYPKEVMSFDAVTGQHLWSKALNRVQPSISFPGDCLEVTYFEQVEGPENAVTTTICRTPASLPSHSRAPTRSTGRAPRASRRVPRPEETTTWCSG